MNMMVKTTVSIPEELARALKLEAKKTGKSQAELIRSAIADSIDVLKREIPRSFGIVSDVTADARHFEE